MECRVLATRTRPQEVLLVALLYKAVSTVAHSCTSRPHLHGGALAFPLFCFSPSLGLRLPTCVRAEEEKTLAMIKPDGLLGGYKDKIKSVLLDSGFHVLREMTLQLDEDNVTLFYAEHSEKSFFPSLVKYMTSGPVYVMVLEKENAISDWRVLIGPTDARKARVSHPGSIRAMCGLDLERNCVHGSDSPQSAAREITFFFGVMSPGDVATHDEL